jgi:diguanylate cyclase
VERSLRVLLVEDSEDDADLVIHDLERGGYALSSERVDTPEGMRAALDGDNWDIVIADYALPQFSALAALTLVRQRGLDLPFIILSGAIGEETAVAAMRAGAHDYVMKGNTIRLGAAIERELREAGERRQRKQAEETIKYLAYYDALTHLPNRTLLQQRLSEALASCRNGSSVALLVMDLTNFREINDALGHSFGDLLFQDVATSIQGVLPAADTVARLGGDEFGILLPGADGAAAIGIAELILGRLQKPFCAQGHSIVLSASIGIALAPQHGADAETLLRRADVARYQAKNNDTDWAVYAPENDESSSGRLALTSELREAIERGSLLLHYQPQVGIASGKVTGVEALARWQHAEFGLVPPQHFIPLAEQTGLIAPLTRWAIAAAADQARVWANSGAAASVAVNLSMRNLRDPDLVDFVAGVMASSQIPPGQLKLEVTESAFMANPARAIDVLSQLRSIGVRIAVDDFGTGYSSLSYLKRLPVNEIKIDKSFVTTLATDPNDVAIVRSTIELGHNLGLDVVAEGVEDRETWDLLADLNCDAIQGYVVSRPLPAGEALEEILFGWQSPLPVLQPAQ